MTILRLRSGQVRRTVTRLYEALVGRRNGHDAELDAALAAKNATAVDRRHASADVRRTMQDSVEIFALPLEEAGHLLQAPRGRHDR